jgi:cutinase-like protein
MPSAQAAPCPDAEVVFARGTTELPGVGPTGEAFVDALRAQVAGKSLGVYGVDYPATTDFPTAVDGIIDARSHILSTVANCPKTKIVVGGFSQGAAVAGFITANVIPDGVGDMDVPPPLSPEVADHIAAVALFGKPSERFMRVINDPDIVIGPQYVAKTVDLCVDNDLVCDPHGGSFQAHNEYAESGMTDQGATFVAQKLQAAWAADAAASSATPASPTPSTPAPSPLSAQIGASQPQHLGQTSQTLPGPAPLPGPAAPAAPPPDIEPLA